MTRSLRSRSKVEGEEKNLKDEKKKVEKIPAKTKTPVTPGKYVRVTKIKKIDTVPRSLRPRSNVKEPQNLQDETMKVISEKKTTKTATIVTREKNLRSSKTKIDDKGNKLLIKNSDNSPSPVLRDRTNIKIPGSKKPSTKQKKTEENPSTMKQTTLKESFAKGKKKSPVKPPPPSPPPTKQKIPAPVYKKISITSPKKSVPDEDHLYDFEHYYNLSEEESGKKKRKRNASKNPPANKKVKTTVVKAKIPKWKEDLKHAKLKIPRAGQTTKASKVPSETKGKSDILKAIEDFHRIPNANDPVSIKPSNKNQVIVQVHDNPLENDDNGNYNDDSVGDMSFEQPGAPDDDDDDNDQSMPTEEAENLKVPKENEKLPLTPIKGFRKTIAFNKKPSVQNISSEEEQIEESGDKKVSALTPVTGFRKTNIFNVKSSEKNSTMDDTLIGQSLSPIPKRDQTNFDESSPWRPNIVSLKPSFSRVKNVVQSTPQSKKLPEKVNKDKKSSTLAVTMEKISENVDIGDSPRKNVSNSSKSPRKFGTELLNINGSASESSGVLGTTVTTTILEPKVDKNIPAPTILPIVTVNSPEVSVDGNSENKENEYKSPKKSPSKRNRLLLDSPRSSIGKPSWPKSKSPVKTSEPASSIYDKQNNINQQPGPSGLDKKRQPLVERRVKKQSNLHVFLNMPDMSEGTKITTPHGIFDDLKSPESSIKSHKKSTIKNNSKQLNVDNLFGFEEDIVDDNDDDDELLKNSPLFSSPTKAVVKKPIVKSSTLVGKKPRIVSDERLRTRAQLSAGQMKILLKDKKSKDTENKNATLKDNERDKLKDDENEASKIDENSVIKENVGPTKEDIAISFSDTFDLASEEQKQSEKIADVPLFADLEPVRFKQPPRYSYNRKRKFTYETEDEEDGDTDADDHKKTRVKRSKKKQRISKEEREQKKILDEWAKNLNKHFQGVEGHELHVD